MKRPFIFEGLDGAGKTTLAHEVAMQTGVKIISSLDPNKDAQIKNLIKTKDISVGKIHKLYMEAISIHLEDVIQPALFASEVFLIDKWVAGMLSAHVARGGNLVNWTLDNYNWDLIKVVDCLFLRASDEVRKRRLGTRRIVTKTDKASFHKGLETIYLQFAQRFYRRVILLEVSDFNKKQALHEALRILSI